MRIVFAGTPDFAVPSLIAAARRNEVVAVYTQPDRPAGRGRALTPSPVKRAALERGIEVFQPESLKSQVSRDALRSEEHTSELQSLMRISYAVFCLKKKTQPNKTYTTKRH